MATAHDVVVITTHDIGRHLHCYGVEGVVSPNLDALASSGVRFELAFATAPQCSPSRASLATGRYPHNHGVMGLAHRGFDWELAPDAPHAAAIFAGLGFETHLFGAQHVTQHPERLDRPYPPPGPIPRDLVIPGYLPAGREAAEEMTAVEGAITRMDAAAGRVLVALDKAARADRALVVFTTDHGLAMPRAKCTLYDPGLEVALIVRWPGAGIGSGVVRSELVSNIDVLPTLLEGAGAPVQAGIQGRSFLPLLRGDAYEPREAIFAEKTFHSYYDPMRCVRTRRHKYIRNFEAGFAVEVPADIQQGPIFRANPSRYSTDRPSVVELYDLEADPLEEHNLAGRPNLRSVEDELSAELWRWMRETDDPLLNGPIASPRYRQAMQP